jgi:hypothetical protein
LILKPQPHQRISTQWKPIDHTHLETSKAASRYQHHATREINETSQTSNVSSIRQQHIRGDNRLIQDDTQIEKTQVYISDTMRTSLKNHAVGIGRSARVRTETEEDTRGVMSEQVILESDVVMVKVTSSGEQETTERYSSESWNEEEGQQGNQTSDCG